MQQALFVPFLSFLLMNYCSSAILGVIDVMIENDYRSSPVAASPRFHLPV
jgi:hypothetical protein